MTSNDDVQTVTVSPSKISVFQTCPKQYDYVYRQDLRKKSPAQHFDLGLYLHESLHAYYQALKATPNMPKEALGAMLQQKVRNDIQGATPNQLVVLNRARKILERYVLVQSPKIDHGITVLEYEYGYELPVELPSGRTVTLNGYIDLVYATLRGKHVVRDHKSTGNIRTFSAPITKADGQLLFYGTVWYMLTGTVPAVEFSILNTYDYKGVPNRNNEFLVYTVHHTEKVYQSYWRDLLILIDEMLDSEPTPHYNRHCSSCAFFDLCSFEMQGASVENLKKANYELRSNVRRETITEQNATVNAGN